MAGARYTVQPGTPVRVLHMVSDSVPQTIRFTAKCSDGGAPSGEVVERRGSFFGPREQRYPLQDQNSFRKGMFDVAYSLTVTADSPVEIEFQSRHFRSKWLLLTLLLVLLLGMAAALPALLMQQTR